MIYNWEKKITHIGHRVTDILSSKFLQLILLELFRFDKDDILPRHSVIALSYVRMRAYVTFDNILSSAIKDLKV